MEKPPNRPVAAAFGQFLTSQRVAKQMTQKEVASLLGTSTASYKRMERGYGKVDFELAVAVCEALGVSITQFVREYKA